MLEECKCVATKSNTSKCYRIDKQFSKTQKDFESLHIFANSDNDSNGSTKSTEENNDSNKSNQS